MTAPKSQAAIVYNPTKVNLAALKKAVAAGEKKAGWKRSLWLETTEDDPGTGQAQEAVDKKVNVVLAAGGDGTVRAVAETLSGTETALGLLPSGTGNLLARNLDHPLDNLARSIDIAFTGADRPIDVGIAEAKRPDGTRERNLFLVMAGVGLDAQMIANTNPELKRRVGWLAYVDAIARSLRRNHKVRLRFTVDDSPVRSMIAHTILVGNCGTLPGNILLLPEAKVDDGIFDLVALRPKGLFGWIQIWAKITWENGVLRRSAAGRKLMSYTKEIRTLRYITGHTFVARFSRPEAYELDGDSFGKAVAIRVMVDPLALIVRVPASS